MTATSGSNLKVISTLSYEVESQSLEYGLIGTAVLAKFLAQFWSRMARILPYEGKRKPGTNPDDRFYPALSTEVQA